MGILGWLKRLVTSSSETVISIHTGDRKNAEIFDPKVCIVLYDDEGQKSTEIHLDKFHFDNSQHTMLNQFPVDNILLHGVKLDKLEKLEFWRDNSVGDWYIDKVEVKNTHKYIYLLSHFDSVQTYNFPVFRWVRRNCHMLINHLDTSLPQYEENQEQIRKELEEKRKVYVYSQAEHGLPVQVKSVPSDEKFSFAYEFDLGERLAKNLAGKAVDQFKSGHWDHLSELCKMYNLFFGTPKDIDGWKDDVYFGAQRLVRLNHSLIRLCTAIPDKLKVTDELLKPLLEGLTIKQAIQRKRLFICDLGILDGVHVKNNFVLCSPIALFFVDSSDLLKPVAIQLFQKPGPDNPIFLPTDGHWTWTLVKMWYNNADAAYHQGVAHLCLTHLLMEGVAVCTHRQLAQSHPIFKLLAPHFLFLIPINSAALHVLINEGGWVDKSMTYGRQGMFEVIRRRLVTWRVDVDGTLPEDLKARGLYGSDVLPGYHFRDDALLLYNAIKKYVTAYVHLYYDSVGKLVGDWEIQAWAAELVKERDDSEGGVGLKGVPGDGRLTSTDQLITVLTFVIYTCSVVHASVNFAQYDEYGFPPKYPAILRGQPPRDKSAMTEADVIKTIPDKPTTLEIMNITKLLSMFDTNGLGNFEVKHIADHNALKIVEDFQQELRDMGKVINQRNEARSVRYEYLHPEVVPNAISI